MSPVPGTGSSRLRGRTLLVAATWAVSIAFGAIWLVIGPAGATDLQSIASFAGLVAGASVGALLVIRVPGNPIGWLLLIGIGLVNALDNVLPAVAMDVGGSSGAVWSEWFTQMLFLPSLLLIVVFLPLLFPTGRLPSPRWRPVAEIALVTLVWGTVGVVFQGPFALRGALSDLYGVLTSVVSVLCAMVLLGVASLLVRFRRASGIERTHLGRPTALATIAGSSGVIAFLTFGASGWNAASYDAFIVSFVATTLLAVAITIAVRDPRPDGLGPTIAWASTGLPPGRRSAVLAGSAIGVVLIAASLALARPGGADDAVSAIAQAAASLATITVGTLLVRRSSHERIGWLLWAGGLLGAISGAASGLADYGLNVNPGSVPGAIWLAWLSQWIFVPYFWVTGGLLPLLYPSGRLSSSRWRTVVIAGTLVAAILSVEAALVPWLPGLFPVDNPFATSAIAGDVAGLVGSSNFLLYIVIVAAVVSLVARYRGAVGIEREQLKWFVAVLAIGGPAVILGVVAGGSTNTVTVVSTWAFNIARVALVFLPVAIGIAILRYRLYEIDRLISRTIGYGVLTAIVGGLFVGFILVFQAVLSPVTKSNELAVAGSTLVVATLFQPIRRRVQQIVDRRFNRARYDTERTLAAFAGRLRDEVDLEALRAEIGAAVAQTVEPTSISLWLRG